MAEFSIRGTQRAQRRREALEQRLERRQIPRARVRHSGGEPRGNVVRHQKVTVPRTLIGIMCTL